MISASPSTASGPWFSRVGSPRSSNVPLTGICRGRWNEMMSAPSAFDACVVSGGHRRLHEAMRRQPDMQTVAPRRGDLRYPRPAVRRPRQCRR